MGRPRKKVIFVLVEGNTDEAVLREPIVTLFENKSTPESTYEVVFSKMKQNDRDTKIGGDVTSKWGVTVDNVESVISKTYIDDYLIKHNYIYLRDIVEVIHIVDLDGAFIDENRIKYDVKVKEDDKPYYTEDEIMTGDVEGIKARNRQKSAILVKLCNLDMIELKHRNKQARVKYSIYFFSCNMDHFIHKKLNLPNEEKCQLARDFEAFNNLDAFKHIVYDDPAACLNMTYQDSWKLVMKENESLKRHTNLNILIDML